MKYNIERIKQIEERLNATTSGSWRLWRGISGNEDLIPYNGFDDPIIESENGLFICQTTYDNLSGTQEHNVNEDTIFIANSKDDIRYLLDVIAELVNENKHK